MKLKPTDPQEVLNELMRHDFGVFLRKAFPWVTGGDPINWNWHLDAIVHSLDQVRVGKSRRLMVNLAPRNGKSVAISVAWVAWMLGRDPKHRFVCVSYSNDLSYNLARQCLDIMQSPWYRQLFPATILRRTAAHDFETTRGGGRLATSITGTLTGRGGDTIILDDLIKPQEVNSEVVRASVNAWYQTTLSSRLNDKSKGAIICVMQRLHEYDLPGLLIETGRYDVLSLPSIATHDQIIQLPRGRVHLYRVDDVLHPARESRATLDEQRADMGSDAYSAQYLQAPVPATGNLIKAAWFRTYDPATIATLGGRIVQSVDTANKGSISSDFSVVVTALVKGKYTYILDVSRFRADFPELRKRVIALARQYKPHALLIEDQGSGIALIEELRLPEVHGMPPVIGRKATIEKVERVRGITAMIEGGQLLLPPDAPWLGEFKAELLACPKGRFDDQVDALTHLLTWVREQQMFTIPNNVGAELYSVDEWGYGSWSGGGYDTGEGALDHDPWLGDGPIDDVHEMIWGNG